eukprot:ctg_4130.g548
MLFSWRRAAVICTTSFRISCLQRVSP